MTGAEICNLMDSLKARNISDSEIINIIYEVEGRRSIPKIGEKQDSEK